LHKILKSVLKTAVDLLEHSDRVSGKLHDRFSEGVNRAGDRVSDLRDRASALYGHEDHTIRNVITFVAGVGVGVGVAMLCAPASGDTMRNSIGEKAKDVGKRVRDRLSPRVTATGTEGI
jgi:hypothetical protein